MFCKENKRKWVTCIGNKEIITCRGDKEIITYIGKKMAKVNFI